MCAAPAQRIMYSLDVSALKDRPHKCRLEGMTPVLTALIVHLAAAPLKSSSMSEEHFECCTGIHEPPGPLEMQVHDSRRGLTSQPKDDATQSLRGPPN